MSLRCFLRWSFIATILCSSLGCAALREFRDRSNGTWAEREEREASERQARFEQQEWAEANLSRIRPGMAIQQVHDLTGLPDRIDFRGGIPREYLEINGTPYVFTYDAQGKILIAWERDEDRISRERHEGIQREEQRRANRARMGRAFGEALQRMGNGLQQPVNQGVNCTSQGIGNMIYTKCD